MRSTSALLLLALASQSCSDKGITSPPHPTPSSSYSDSINAFLGDQGVPKPQEVHTIVASSDSEIVVFRLYYGDLHYDLAGNWYDVAFGIRYENRTGWVEAPNGITGARMFIPSSSDAFLYSEETWRVLESAPDVDGWVYWGAFLPTLAAGTEVPEPTLLAIANQMNTYISPYVAWLLLGNPTVQNSRQILTVLANLPVFQGDLYGPIRVRAQELLDALPPS